MMEPTVNPLDWYNVTTFFKQSLMVETFRFVNDSTVPNLRSRETVTKNATLLTNMMSMAIVT